MTTRDCALAFSRQSALCGASGKPSGQQTTVRMQIGKAQALHNRRIWSHSQEASNAAKPPRLLHKHVLMLSSLRVETSAVRLPHAIVLSSCEPRTSHKRMVVNPSCRRRALAAAPACPRLKALAAHPSLPRALNVAQFPRLMIRSRPLRALWRKRCPVMLCPRSRVPLPSRWQ